MADLDPDLDPPSVHTSMDSLATSMHISGAFHRSFRPRCCGRYGGGGCLVAPNGARRKTPLKASTHREDAAAVTTPMQVLLVIGCQACVSFALCRPHGRREVLLGSVLVPGLVLLQRPGPASADDAPPGFAAAPMTSTTSTIYEDPVDKFTLLVPAGWAYGVGAVSGATPGPSGARRTVSFFPDDPSVHDVSVTVVITNVSVEFTKLGSLGNIEAFAGNLVGSQDQSMLLRQPDWARKKDQQIQIAKLVSYKSTGDKYNVEYTIQKLPGPTRHLMSSLMLGSNGRYNRLYTVTGQCPEEELPKYKDVLAASVSSLSAELLPSA